MTHANMPEPITAGNEFGRGMVLDSDIGRNGHRDVMVRLRCVPELGGCGATYEARADHLRAGSVQSCGCLRRELAVRNGRDSETHGLSRHPLYLVWSNMIQRCENPDHRAFPYYGGRVQPITVWGPWHDPARFIADVEAEIGPRPEGRTPGGIALWTLERKNNDAGYRPGNVEWADWPTQRRNQRPRGGGKHPFAPDGCCETCGVSFLDATGPCPGPDAGASS